jgi:hypothetical protein
MKQNLLHSLLLGNFITCGCNKWWALVIFSGLNKGCIAVLKIEPTNLVDVYVSTQTFLFCFCFLYIPFCSRHACFCWFMFQLMDYWTC